MVSEPETLTDPGQALPAASATGPAPDRPGILNGLSRVLLDRPGLPVQAGILIAAVGAAFVVRMSVADILPPGFPFVTFFPAILITAVFASIPAGVAAAVLSGLLAWYHFIPPASGFSFEPPALVAMSFFVAISATDLFFIALSARALRNLRDERERATRLARSRDLMFSELQHRVSNNLTTVGALLRLQAGRVQDPAARQALLESMQRLNIVARIQRNLYAPDDQAIDVRSFLDTLAQDIREAFPTRATAEVSLSAEDFRIEADQAVPFGLVASEMLMNSLEHARPDGGKVRIEISCRQIAQEGSAPLVRLAIADDGQGLPKASEPGGDGSLGVGIASQLARSLDGTLRIANRADGPGTLADLQFPLAQVPAAAPG